jgi:DNA-binding transcriptional LysR family regulator
MQDWDDIRIFLAVSRAGSLNAAARLVGLTQPTISRRIMLFERRLGVALFARSQEGLALTEGGKSLWKRALAMEEHAQAINRQILRHDDRLAGVVRITTTEGLGAYWLTKRLVGLAGRHPDLTVEVLLDNGLTDLMKRDADIALRLSRPVTPELVGRRVGEMAFALHASSDYIEAHGAPASRDDLAHHRLVAFMWDNASGGEPWRALAEGHNHVAYRCNSSFGHVHAVRAGFGIGLLPTYIREEYPELVVVLPELDWGRRDIWLVAHRDVKMNARIRMVYNEVASQFALARRGRPASIEEPAEAT